MCVSVCLSVSISVCLCLCVHPQAIKNHSREMKLNNQSNKSYHFSIFCMPLAIDTIDGRGLSNEARYELLPKKSYAVFAIHFTVKGI